MTTKYGPYGGSGGVAWDDGNYKGIKQIILYAGDVVDSIQVDYVDDEGRIVSGAKHGGSGGSMIKVELDYPSEYIISVFGTSINYYGNEVINSLGFYTTKGTRGSYGAPAERVGASSFKFPPGAGKVVGFCGRAGTYLDAIGGYVENIYNTKSTGPSGGQEGKLA